MHPCLKGGMEEGWVKEEDGEDHTIYLMWHSSLIGMTVTLFWQTTFDFLSDLSPEIATIFE